MKTKFQASCNSIERFFKENKLLIWGCLIIIGIVILLSFCINFKKTTQIGDNTFIYGHKVYKIVDNELNEIANLNSDSIRKFQVYQPVKREFGKSDLSFVKKGAYGKLEALYRGNILYFNLYILELNDLKDNYTNGNFVIHFEDEYGFIIHSKEISTSELTGNLDGDNNTIIAFSYNGKTEMSSDIYKAIKRYSISSSVKTKSNNSIWDWYN